MNLQDEIKRQQELRKAQISSNFTNHDDLIEKASKWKLGDVDPKYPNYFVAAFNAKGQPVWKSKSKHKDHEHHPEKKRGEKTGGVESLEAHQKEVLMNLRAMKM